MGTGLLVGVGRSTPCVGGERGGLTMISVSRCLALGGLLVLLAACSRSSGGSPLAPGGEDQAKLNAYTEGYNIMVGEFGLKQQLDDYQKAGINGPHPTPETVYLTGGWLDQARAKLQAARAMPGGGLADADAAADRFLPALQQVLTHEASLNGYYQSKAWRDDGLARGKREDPVLVGEFHTAFATAAPLDAALTRARDTRERAQLAALKASGNAVAYQSQLALSQARGLVQSFHNQADLHDPTKLAAANATAATLEKTLVDQHAAVAKAKAGLNPGSIDGFRVDSCGRAGDDLDRLLGAYRDLKAGGGAKAYQSMVAAFNSAVSGVNVTIQTGAG